MTAEVSHLYLISPAPYVSPGQRSCRRSHGSARRRRSLAWTTTSPTPCPTQTRTTWRSTTTCSTPSRTPTSTPSRRGGCWSRRGDGTPSWRTMAERRRRRRRQEASPSRSSTVESQWAAAGGGRGCSYSAPPSPPTSLSKCSRSMLLRSLSLSLSVQSQPITTCSAQVTSHDLLWLMICARLNLMCHDTVLTLPLS